MSYNESDKIRYFHCSRKDVNDMCNLSHEIKEQADVEGTENRIAIGKQE